MIHGHDGSHHKEKFSLYHKAIVLAALGKGEMILKGALWSEDTEAMVDCMKRASAPIFLGHSHAFWDAEA